jgi:hypothetical protein
MIPIQAIRDAAESIKASADAHIETIKVLSLNETLIERNEKANVTSELIFRDYVKPTSITEEQTNFMEDHCNWALPGMNYKSRSFITEAIKYYFKQPAHEKMEERYRNDIRRQESYIDDLNTSLNAESKRLIEAQEQIAKLQHSINEQQTRIAHLIDCNNNQVIAINEHEDTIKKIQADNQMMLDYIRYAKGTKTPKSFDEFARDYTPAMQAEFAGPDEEDTDSSEEDHRI